MQKLLFVCTENRFRSATAEKLFSTYSGLEVIGAGTNRDSPTQVSGDLIEWADVIFAMEKTHRSRMQRKHKDLLRDKNVIVLDIPDDYDYMQPELIKLLKIRVGRHIVLEPNR
jgi:predicted protein tyrosine phosphatase